MDGDLVEIGAYMGGGTAKLAKYARKHGKRVYAIDIFEPGKDTTETDDGVKMCDIYEAFLEGILLFTIIWIYASKTKPRGTTTALFLIFYGIIRFFCEFFREPDAHLGFFFGWLTWGQILTLPMIAIGGYMLWFYGRKSNIKLNE